MLMNVAEAKSRLSELLAAAEAGEDVIIARGGKPAVRLTPVAKDPFPFGSAPELATMNLDFDTPMPEEDLALWEGGP